MLVFLKQTNFWGQLILRDHVVILDREIERIIASLENDLEVSIYLFGSFMSGEKSNDIDLLIVYNNGFYAQIKELKKVVSLQLQRKYNIPIHFTTLTKEEFECLENMKAMQAHVVYSNVK